MDNPNCNTTHKKGQHLTSEERHEIEVRLKDGWTIYKIAKHLSRPYNTIKNEVERGTVLMYRGTVKRYKADEGKKVYLEHRQNSRKSYKCLETVDFLKYHNRMLRRFIPKGKSINDYSTDDILFFADTINGLPRKILKYRTPDELFDKELDKIYAA